MKKRIFALILCIISVFSLAACQPTPEVSIVEKKDTERLVERAQEEDNGEKLETFELPEENYIWSATGAEGRLTVNVDAAVRASEGKLPMAQVSGTGFAQETVTGLFNYLFPEEKLLTTDWDQPVQTKKDIQDTILLYKKLIAESTIEEQTALTEEEALEEIERLEKELTTAPDTAPEPEWRESDGSLIPDKWEMYYNNEMTYQEDIYSLKAQGADSSITVNTPASPNGTSEAAFLYSRDIPDAPDYNSRTVIAALTEEANALPPEAEGKLGISFMEAKQLCDGFFAAGNVMDMQLGRAYLIGGSSGSSDNLSGDMQYAYEFYYVRTVNGAAAAGVGDLMSGDNGYDSFDGATDVTVPWGYETAMFHVNDSGIYNIHWASPTETGEVLAEDTVLLSFEEIMDIFETMILAIYEPTAQQRMESDELQDWNMRVQVSEIELGLVRIRTQNADGREGIYTPAWVFYGNEEEDFTYTNGETYTFYDGRGDITGAGKPTVMLVINAIDGSIIDLDKGY